MGFKPLRDLAAEKGVNIRSLQTHVKNHQDELDGHVLRYGPPRGTFVDEFAEEFLSGLLVGHPIATADPGLIAENERLKGEVADLQKRVIQLQDEKADLMERAITAEASKALMETTAATQGEQLQQLQEQVERLKSRSLWERITRRYED